MNFNEIWTDERGQEVPVEYITKTQKLMEKTAFKIFKEATKINEGLVALKQFIAEKSDKIFLAVMKERDVDVKKRKRNFTWFNFDRSIKIEVVDNEVPKFDDMLLTTAREKLLGFLDKNIDPKIQFIKEMVLDAFQTRNGQIDYKKIFILLKYKDKIPDSLFQSAMGDLEEAYRLVSSKMYYRVWVKDDKGEYKIIDLNFSNV